MDWSGIERLAWELQRDIWRSRVTLSIDAGSPLKMLEPAIGAAVLGVRYEVVEEGLGSMGPPGPVTEVAGRMDRRANLIQVSGRFPEVVQRFTGAHELGHVVMHPHNVMHRDRPLEGGLGRGARSREEKEADFYAACFLMPARMVLQSYEKRFDAPPLHVDDDLAFRLSPDDPDVIWAASPEDLAGMVAGYKNPRSSPVSLAEEFRVSVSAMALRLLEVKAVQ